MLEALERRCLMSAAVEQGILSIYGSEGVDRVDVSLADGLLIVDQDGARSEFAAGEVVGIRALLGAGGDRFSASSVDVPAEVFGGPGHDIITGGLAGDMLRGGRGRDSIMGLAGDDEIFGGRAADLLRGGRGADVIMAGAGDDVMRGGEGVDRLNGGDGRDNLQAGDGSAIDILEGGPGADIAQIDLVGTSTDTTDTVETISRASTPVLITAEELRAQVIDYAVQQQKSQFGTRVHVSNMISQSYWWNTCDYAAEGVVFLSDFNNSTSLSTAAGSTNVQESNVDEADLVETDGRYLYTYFGGKLRVVDTDDALNTLAEVDVPGAADGMYLNGNRLTVISSDAESPVDSMRLTSSRVAVYDVSDPAVPQLVRETYLEGGILTTRRSDGGLQLVLRNQPRLPVVLYRISEDGNYVTYETEAEYRARIEGRDLCEVLPGYATRTGEGAWLQESLNDSGAFGVTAGTFPSFLTVVSIANEDDAPVQSLSFADDYGSRTIYSSGESLYVANTTYNAGWDTTITQVDFGESGPMIAATGPVPGSLMGQFAMDEENGILRVVSRRSATTLSLLQRQGDQLITVGQVGDIAPGESVMAVRYTGDTAYVVTFRRVDPLFVIDLSDPANPTVKGELIVPGFSSYLHPIEGDMLVGVGYSGQWSSGIQVSLFDVSNPLAPSRLGVASDFQSGYSVSGSHLQFTWIQQHDTAVISVRRNSYYGGGETQYAAVFVHAAADDVSVISTIAAASENVRTVVIGDAGYVCDTAGIKMVQLGGSFEVVAEKEYA